MLTIALLPTVHDASAHGRPHDQAQLEIGLDDGILSIELDAPLDSVLGFGRAPRTDPERKSAEALLRRVRQGDALFRPDAAARCVLGQATVVAPAVQAADPGPASRDPKDHGLFVVSYEFTCGNPAQLQTVVVELFTAFPRLRTIQVRLAGPDGQFRSKLQRSDGRSEVTLRR